MHKKAMSSGAVMNKGSFVILKKWADQGGA